MSVGKVKASKTKVHPLPEEGSGDGKFHVYVFDVVAESFRAVQAFDNIERAASFQRHQQEKIYLEQEADPDKFDLPFVSADPALIERIARESEYRARLIRELIHDARSRARKR
jgi:hypothetical protein